MYVISYNTIHVCVYNIYTLNPMDTNPRDGPVGHKNFHY